ncbi:MAG: CD225/dispanin family protein [Prolixibacteraceae bacterium]|nr:CD225/dispanin family protein [Prolixibacteraceae bacterium]
MNDNQPVQPPPSNYLVFAILTTLFCCQILGIVSIVYAAQVNSKWYAGDYQGSIDASRNAKLWAWVAFGIGIISWTIWILLGLFGVLASLGTGLMFFDM